MIAVAVLLTGCSLPTTPGSGAPPGSGTSPGGPPTSSSPTIPSATGRPGGCHARGVLPDPVCTPGATDPSVTQDTLLTTICATGWTRSRRPPWSWSGPVKRERMTVYGLADAPASGFELDHLVPLGLGGAATDLRNLWPEPGASPNRKDDAEVAAVHAVCTRRITLAEAQHLMAADWTVLATRLAVP
jgi:hypothetical protein